MWVKYYQSPGDGILRDDYWGTTFTGDREAITAQSQTAENWAAQWSGVIRSNWSMEAAGGDLQVAHRGRDLRGGHSQRRADRKPRGRQVLQRRHVRRFRGPPAPAVQRRQQLVPDRRRPRPQRQGRLRLPEPRVGCAVRLPEPAVLHRRELQPGDANAGLSVRTRSARTTTRVRRFPPARSTRCLRATRWN